MIGQQKRWSRFVGLLAVLALVTAACGSSVSTSTEAETNVEGETTEKDDATVTTAHGDDAMEDDEAKDGSTGAAVEGAAVEGAAVEGAAVEGDGDDDGDGLLSEDEQVAYLTANMESGEWGIDDNNVLNGPSGYKIDLNECADGWSDTEGISDDTITLGVSTSVSGTLASYGLISEGQRNYYDYLNGVGGIGGKNIELIIKDDAYEPARTISNVQELMDRDNVFAFSSTLGTPNNLAIYDDVNEACIPHLSAATGHPAWGDPEFHPWSTGTILPYNSEALLWGEYLKDTYPDGVTVAALVINNDAGVAWRTNFEEYQKANPDVIKEFSSEAHEASAPNVTNEMTTLAGTNADVMIAMTGTIYCTQAMQEVQQAAWDPKEKIVTGVCSSITSYFEPAGDSGEGWILIGSLKDLADSRFDGDEFVELARTEINKAGLDANNGMYGSGWNYAWVVASNMAIAEQLPGGLTRTNLMLAHRTMKTKNPMVLDDVIFELNGNADGHVIEGGQFLRYTIPDGETSGTMEPFGKVFDVNGTTPNCTFQEPPEGQC